MRTKLKRKNILGIFVIIFTTLLSTEAILAQTNDSIIDLPRPTNSALTFGIGSSNLYDTYLSPLKYTGNSFRVTNERMKRLNLLKGRLYKQQIIDLEFADVNNPAKTALEYWLLLNIRLGGHYELINDGKFRLRIGGVWDVGGGLLYNQRNGNNPVSARIYINFNLSAIAFYNWNKFTFRWQIDTPFMGVMFSPKFGQSYYEISIRNSLNTVNFSSLHNVRALRNYFTIDYPFYNITLRVGYLGSFYQTKVHDINTHAYSNSFIIGLVKESINLSGWKTNKKIKLDSSYC